MLMCLALVTETLLYCYPLLAFLALAHVRSRLTSMSKSSRIRAPILIHNWSVLSSAVSQLLKGNSNGRQTHRQYWFWMIAAFYQRSNLFCYVSMYYFQNLHVLALHLLCRFDHIIIFVFFIIMACFGLARLHWANNG